MSKVNSSKSTWKNYYTFMFLVRNSRPIWQPLEIRHQFWILVLLVRSRLNCLAVEFYKCRNFMTSLQCGFLYILDHNNVRHNGLITVINPKLVFTLNFYFISWVGIVFSFIMCESVCGYTQVNARQAFPFFDNEITLLGRPHWKFGLLFRSEIIHANLVFFKKKSTYPLYCLLW